MPIWSVVGTELTAFQPWRHVSLDIFAHIRLAQMLDVSSKTTSLLGLKSATSSTFSVMLSTKTEEFFRARPKKLWAGRGVR